MKIEVLVATTDQKNHDLLDKMNIQTDAIVANQCSRNQIEKFTYKGKKIKYLSFSEKGVGLNRNNALSRTDADICIIADDDMIFLDGYEKKIKKVFDENPTADVVILNIKEKEPTRYIIRKKFKVRYYNFMRFGAARIAFRRKSVTKNSIFFNLHFGGGTEFSAGEDVLFLAACLKKKLNIIAVPEYIALLSDERKSTWFQGYTEKFFKDKGVLYAAISNKWAWLLALQYILRRRSQYKGKPSIKVWKLILKGIKEFKNLR